MFRRIAVTMSSGVAWWRLAIGFGPERPVACRETSGISLKAACDVMRSGYRILDRFAAL
jgi:hypothetical protein